MTYCTALLTVWITAWSALIVVGLSFIILEPLFPAVLEVEPGSGTKCTSGIAGAAAECRGCATLRSVSEIAFEMDVVSAASTSGERVSCNVARAACGGSCKSTG